MWNFQGSLYYHPKQCIVIHGKSHSFVLFDSSPMTPDFPASSPNLQLRLSPSHYTAGSTEDLFRPTSWLQKPQGHLRQERAIAPDHPWYMDFTEQKIPEFTTSWGMSHKNCWKKTWKLKSKEPNSAKVSQGPLIFDKSPIKTSEI